MKLRWANGDWLTPREIWWTISLRHAGCRDKPWPLLGSWHDGDKWWRIRCRLCGVRGRARKLRIGREKDWNA